MEAPLPSFTKLWHNKPYPTISPSRPELSAHGKTIIITGGGTGIGARMVQSFAEAGAAKIIISARREEKLKDVKTKTENAFPSTRVEYFVGDIVNAQDLKKVAAEVGGWDVLVLNAGYMAQRGEVTKADLSDWWRAFEVNVKGTALALQMFIPTAKDGATVIALSTGVVTMPSAMAAGGSSYAASKIALSKVMEIFAAENPQLSVKTLHPGIVETDMLAKSGLKGVPIDDVALPADFTVWLCSKEADFIKGRMVACNWDVDEMKQESAQIEQNPLLLTSNIVGWFPGQV